MRMGLGLREYGGWCNPNAVRRVARRLKTAVCALLGCVLATFALTGCGNVNGSDQADAWNEAADPWSYSFGVHVFTEGDGRVLRPVWRVIDVSEHQRNVNWQKVKQSEVDAAILRIGYGHGNEDKYFKNNLAQVRVNRIPHGLYLYSYAYGTDFAREEANFVLQTLRKYSITDKTIPIFYDMEHLDDWGGHTMPTRPIQFEQIAKVFFGALEDVGYTNLGIYTYAHNMATRLDSDWLREYANWIASYSNTFEYGFAGCPDPHAWQYTSTACVPGVTGDVDVSVFDPRFFDVE